MPGAAAVETQVFTYPSFTFSCVESGVEELHGIRMRRWFGHKNLDSSSRSFARNVVQSNGQSIRQSRKTLLSRHPVSVRISLFKL